MAAPHRLTGTVVAAGADTGRATGSAAGTTAVRDPPAAGDPVDGARSPDGPQPLPVGTGRVPDRRPRAGAPSPRPSRRLPTVVLACAGVLCVLAGIGVLLAGPQAAGDIGAPPEPTQPVPSAIPAAADPDPAAATPSPEPVVAGTVPVELVLPGRAVRAPVVAVTTGPAGALLVPEAPSTVGWWSPSAMAGSAAGTTVLAGHVDSAAEGLGALAVLRHVAAGEEIVLRGADGRAVGYRVVARRQYGKAELPPEVFEAGGPPRLVLITCGGRFDRATRHYEDNVVVFADPVT